eukprot:740374-Pelagomonas_calceolata.AAC.1
MSAPARQKPLPGLVEYVTQVCHANFGDPGMGVRVPGAWSKLGATKAMDSSFTTCPRHLTPAPAL